MPARATFDLTRSRPPVSDFPESDISLDDEPDRLLVFGATDYDHPSEDTDKLFLNSTENDTSDVTVDSNVIE